MANEIGARVHYGEAFWRAHHEAWQQSALNQREYCETQGIPLKAFGNWRARFKAEPQVPVRKLLYRRVGLSHRLSHSLSHMTYGSASPGPIVPPPREGYRRKFNEVDKRRIVYYPTEADIPKANRTVFPQVLAIYVRELNEAVCSSAS